MRSSVILLTGILCFGCATANPPAKAQPFREVFLLIPDSSITATDAIIELMNECERIAGSGAAEYLTRPMPGIEIRVDSGRAEAFGMNRNQVTSHITMNCGADALVTDADSESGSILINPASCRNPEAIGSLLRTRLPGSGIPLAAIATAHSTLIRRSVLLNARSHQMIRIGFNPLTHPNVPERIRKLPLFIRLRGSISEQAPNR
jgi:hypothetical protein